MKNLMNKQSVRKPVKDKVVVICGASSGIGRAAALEFAKKGSSLVLASRRVEVLEELANDVMEAMPQGSGVSGRWLSPKDWRKGAILFSALAAGLAGGVLLAKKMYKI